MAIIKRKKKSSYSYSYTVAGAATFKYPHARRNALRVYITVMAVLANNIQQKAMPSVAYGCCKKKIFFFHRRFMSKPLRMGYTRFWMLYTFFGMLRPTEINGGNRAAGIIAIGGL